MVLAFHINSITSVCRAWKGCSITSIRTRFRDSTRDGPYNLPYGQFPGLQYCISYPNEQYNVSFQGWTMAERLCLLICYKIYATQRIRNLCTMLLRRAIASWQGLKGRSSRTSRVLFQSMKKTSAFLQFFLRLFYLFFLVLIAMTSKLKIIQILSFSNRKFILLSSLITMALETDDVVCLLSILAVSRHYRQKKKTLV